MVIWNRKSYDSSEGSPQIQNEEYGKADYSSADQPTGDYHSTPEAASTRLHSGLKARHITMIAIGGAIGTGLIIGTGAALAQAGYVNSVL